MQNHKTNQKNSYIYTTCLFLLLLLLIFGAVIGYQFYSLMKINTALETKNEELLGKLNQLIASADKNTYEYSDSSVVLNTIEQTEKQESPTVVEAITLINDQFNTFKSDWQMLLCLFGVIITILTVAIPLLNYGFLQKDQLNNFWIKVSSILENFENEKDKAIKDVKNTMDECIHILENKVDLLMDNASKSSESVDATVCINTDEQTETIDQELDKNKYESFISKAIDIEPNNAMYYNKRANNYLKHNKYLEALSDFTKAIEIEPENARFYSNRGSAYLKLNQFEDTLRDCTKAIILDPKNANYYRYRGMVYHRFKKFEAAVEDKTKAIELDYSNHLNYYSRAITLHELRRYEEAFCDSTKAIELKPDSAYYLTLHGELSYKTCRFENAKEFINRAIEINSKCSIAYRYRALIAMKEAIRTAGEISNNILSDFNKAIELDPSSAYNLHSRAEYYLYINQDNDAFEDLQKALQLQSNDQYAYFYLGKYWERKNDQEKALYNFKKATEFGYISEVDE